MFQKLEAVEKRYEELNAKIADPAIIANPSEWTTYMKEHAEIEEVVLKYKEYKKELPKIGQFIEKNGYEGRVTELDVLNKSYKIKDDEGNEHIIVVEDNGSSK